MKKIYLNFMLVMSTVIAMPSLAAVTYSVEYAQNSPIKNISLQNADLRVEGYEFENPHGFYNVTTDDKQNFSLQNPAVLEVVSIKGEDKFNARCSGNGTPSNFKIIITCNPK